MCASVRVHTYMCVLRTYITSFALISARMYVCPCVGSSSVDASDKRQCSNPGTHVRSSVRVCGTQHLTDSTPVMKDVQTCSSGSKFGGFTVNLIDLYKIGVVCSCE